MKRILSLLTSIAIGLTVWGLSKIVFPQAFQAISLVQKVFGSVAIVIFVTIIADSVQLLYRIESKVWAIASSLSGVIESDLDEAFKNIH